MNIKHIYKKEVYLEECCHIFLDVLLASYIYYPSNLSTLGRREKLEGKGSTDLCGLLPADRGHRPL